MSTTKKYCKNIVSAAAIRDGKGRKIAEEMEVSYTVDGEERTIAVNRLLSNLVEWAKSQGATDNDLYK